MASRKRVRIVNGEIVTDDAPAPAARAADSSSGSTSFGMSGAVRRGAAPSRPFSGAAGASSAATPSQQAGQLPYDATGHPEWLTQLAVFVGLDGSTVQVPAVPALSLPERQVKRLHLAILAGATAFVGWRMAAFAAVAYVMVNYGQT